jgi:Fe(3+) dicitrate transport protein
MANVYSSIRKGFIIPAICITTAASAQLAHRTEIEKLPEDTLKTYEMPQVTILSQRDGIFGNIPGSASFIGLRELRTLAPVSGNEVFRRVPGLHVVDEEGVGLRANIGIRGLDPDRSRSVHILEDGIPVALNPYGEPELYYTPPIDRMSGVEILKGSGQILYGPQTIGGVINYITADPPSSPAGTIRLRAGQGGYFTGMMGYGTTFGNTGIQVNYLRKQASNMAGNAFNINDVNAKLKLQLSPVSRLGIKLGFYDETSNATYIGITQSMYNMGGSQDFVRIAPDDNLDVRRYSASITHEYNLSENVTLKTTGFGYTTTRNWQRQDFTYNTFNSEGILNPKPATWTGVTWGDESVPGGALYMRNSTGNRNRQFEVAGIEPRINAKYALGNINNELDAGARFMYERAFEQLTLGQKKDAASGNLVEDEIRTGLAGSVYAQNRFDLTRRFSVTAGARLEYFDYERNILRRRFNNIARDTNIVSNNNLYKLIPGAGFNYTVNNSTSVFGGIHRGFAPPRVKDAITGSGEVINLDAELSWNSEVGVRSVLGKGINFEATVFRMNFSNQIIPVSVSSGGTGAGLVNGGRTLHQGAEFGLNVDFGKLIESAYSLRFDVNSTFVDARFTDDRFVSPGANRDAVNIIGNRTPYAPAVLLSSSFTFEAPFGLGFRLTGTHTGRQFGDPLNTVAPSNNGRIGEIAAFTILDATAMYRLANTGLDFNFSVKNMTNERYIASRRPEGIRVGMPRFISAGVEYNF